MNLKKRTPSLAIPNLPLCADFSILKLVNIRLGVLHAVAFTDRSRAESVDVSWTLLITIAILLAVL